MHVFDDDALGYLLQNVSNVNNMVKITRNRCFNEK